MSKDRNAFEIAMLEGIAALNNKFDSLNRRMTAIEAKFKEMDELVEHIYQRDHNDNIYKSRRKLLFDSRATLLHPLTESMIVLPFPTILMVSPHQLLNNKRNQTKPNFLLQKNLLRTKALGKIRARKENSVLTPEALSGNRKQYTDSPR